MKDGRFFLDTNILLYTFDKTAPHKQAIANDLVEQALQGNDCISFQVMQEFLNTALRKFAPHDDGTSTKLSANNTAMVM